MTAAGLLVLPVQSTFGYFLDPTAEAKPYIRAYSAESPRSRTPEPWDLQGYLNARDSARKSRIRRLGVPAERRSAVYQAGYGLAQSDPKISVDLRPDLDEGSLGSVRAAKSYGAAYFDNLGTVQPSIGLGCVQS